MYCESGAPCGGAMTPAASVSELVPFDAPGAERRRRGWSSRRPRRQARARPRAPRSASGARRARASPTAVPRASAAVLASRRRAYSSWHGGGAGHAGLARSNAARVSFSNHSDFSRLARERLHPGLEIPYRARPDRAAAGRARAVLRAVVDLRSGALGSRDRCGLERMLATVRVRRPACHD